MEERTFTKSRGKLSLAAAWLMFASLVLAGCAMETFAPDTAPEYVIIRDFSAFYRLGPQQGRGPDASLRTGIRVKLLRREMGYSLVQLDDLRTGYMANEDMTVAPPRPPEEKLRESSRESAGTGRKRAGRSQAENSPIYSGPQINDTPLPDPNVPPPDLNVEPEIMPDTISVPASKPAGTPKFRY